MWGGNGSHLPTGVCRQIHFGSQCATESVYRYLPAKVKLTKFHFGKPPSVESAVRHPLCQSELAELQRVCKYTLKAMPSTAKRRARSRGVFAASDQRQASSCGLQLSGPVDFYGECAFSLAADVEHIQARSRFGKGLDFIFATAVNFTAVKK